MQGHMQTMQQKHKAVAGRVKVKILPSHRRQLDYNQTTPLLQCPSKVTTVTEIGGSHPLIYWMNMEYKVKGAFQYH